MKNEWINSDVLDKVGIKVLHTSFYTAKPFKHIQIENFLNGEKAEKLIRALKKEKFHEKDSDLFQFRQTNDLKYSKNKHILDFIKYMNSEEGRKIMIEITGIKLNKIEGDVFGSLYQDTDFLLCHDDRLEKRKIAYILYLCEDFNEIEGGSLILYSDEDGKPKNIEKRYAPKWNTLFLFEVGEKSWHEVEEILGDKKRYAIGGWYY